MTDKQSVISTWPLLLMWIVANLVGWAAGLAAGQWLVQVVAAIPGVNEDRIAIFAILLATGLTTGIAQWRVMVGHLPQPTRWIGATFSGYLLCLIVIVGGNEAQLSSRFSSAGLWDDAFLLALLGMAIGIPQWWVLRQHYRRAWVWMPAMVVGFLVFLWTIANPVHSLGEFVLLGTIEGTLASAVPGVTLTWLVRHPLVISSR